MAPTQRAPRAKQAAKKKQGVKQKALMMQATHMSQNMAVSTAVSSQLINDKHWPPPDINKVMGRDYRYDLNSISNFLAAVRGNLVCGNPHLSFVFDDNFAKAALNQKVGDLTGSINAITSPT